MRLTSAGVINSLFPMKTRFIWLTLTGALLLAAPAQAKVQTVTMKAGPFTVGGYEVALQGQHLLVGAPKVDGYITRMETDVVDVKTGKTVPISRIMLHHIVFANLGPNFSHVNTPEPFYGDGEERAKMDLPAGYGYPITKNDAWGWVWMLMNHKPTSDSVYIRYKMEIVTGETRKSVIPMVWDTSHGRQARVFDVPGGGVAGSLDVRTDTQTAPVSGRLVAGLGHVHGGAYDLALSEPDCGGRTIYRSSPTWGLASNAFYKVRPVLHEPGPINMTQFKSATGIPVKAGERLTATSRYDNVRPHTRSMGLLLAYLSPDSSVAANCGRLPKDIKVLKTTTKGRSIAPVARIKIYDWNGSSTAKQVFGPPGAMAIAPGNAAVRVKDFAFTAGNLSVLVGSTVTWTFDDAVRHNVTVADGPEGFSSNWLSGGASFSKTLTKAGTYTFFCELHPVGMVQRVVVRP